MQEFIKMARILALTVLVSLGMITCHFDFVFASGYLPTYSSTPSINEITNSPVYFIKNNITYYFAVNNNNSNVDYIYYYNTRNDQYEHLLISKNSFIQYKYYSTDSEVSVSNSNHQQSDNYYFLVAGNISGSNTGALENDMFAFIPDVTNAPDAVAYAFSHTLEYPTIAQPIISKYTFQNGWLSVIDLGSSNVSYNFDLSTSFNVNSGIVSQNWSETSQTYWFSDSLPTVESSYTNQGTLIPWERGTPRNVFGQTKDGIYNLSGTSTGRYLYILNPAFRAIADAEHPSIENHPVTVSGLTNGIKAYVYELTATATLSGVANAISTVTIDGETVFANSGSVTAGDTSEDLTNSFLNSNNETIVQNQGGGNQNSTAQTINNYLENIQNVLDNFVNQFVGLLTAPISHIQQLISAGSNFFQVMAGLFSWLPSDLSSLVVSALSVCLVIGIIKMFL